jgi:hypothetical protein
MLKRTWGPCSRLVILSLAALVLISLSGCSVANGSGTSTPSTAAIVVSISPDTATLDTSVSQQFLSTVSGTTDADVVWLVDGVQGGNVTSGTISASGLFTAPATEPAAAITVTAQSAADRTKSASAQINVKKKAPTSIGITITPATATLQTGMTQQFTASVSGTTDTAVTWLVNGVQGGSSTTGTISSIGLFTAPQSAPASAVTVSARSAADTTKSANASVTIAAAPTPVSVAITPTSASLTTGQTKQFAATVSGTTNTGVTWFAGGVQGGNATVGTISTSGLYTAPASAPSGAVTVMARCVYDSTVTASAAVTVTAASSTNPPPPPPPSGTQYYVSTSGSDTNSGSASSPWKTLTYAASKAGAGATVHVAAGTYNSSSEMKLTSAGTSSARVVFVSDTQWGAKIVSTVTGNSTAVWITGDYVDFVGFDITGPGLMGIYITGSNDRIIGNHVHNMATSGCAAGGGILNGNYSGASNVDIIGNVVHDIGNYTQPCSTLHGIYTANPGGHIWNNIVFRNQGWGIHTWHAASQNNISNNTVVNNGYGGILVGAGDGSWVNTGSVISNNVVYQNGLFSGSNGYGIEEYGNTGSNTFVNNLVNGNGPSDWKLQNGDTASGSISSNPLFASYTQYSTTNDYHLQSGSPAIAKGSATYAPTYDMNGATRANNPTLGVYEYGASAVAWPYMY